MSKAKELGQFWTPNWVAKAMVAFGAEVAPGTMLDPAVGLGVFPLQALSLGLAFEFKGIEKDPDLIKSVPNPSVRARIAQGDFLLFPFEEKFDFIVANPPYIRHHHLSSEYKDHLSQLAEKTLGFRIDRRAGIHIYFLIKSLTLLKPRGRLVFIVPADVFEGKFAPSLWNWIARRYAIRAVVTFTSDASPFPGLDINPIIVFLEHSPPSTTLYWARVLTPATEDLFRFVQSQFRATGKDIEVTLRDTREALDTGLSRPPRLSKQGRFSLKDFAIVRRGIATGANKFFLLSRPQVEDLRLSEEFLVPAVAKTRYLTTTKFTPENLKSLEVAGKPVFLFSPDGRPLSEFPEPVRRYITYGEQLGLHKKSLLSKRNPWYKMETRSPPEFFFAYLGRRNARFVRNLAGAVPLTTLLAVYPYNKSEEHLDILESVLNHPEVLEGLVFVAKSYGGGAIKAEPRQLERLPIPDNLAEKLLSQTTLLSPR